MVEVSGWQIVAVTGILCVTVTICLGMWLGFKNPEVRVDEAAE